MYLIEIPKSMIESLLTQAQNLIDITTSQPTDRIQYEAVMTSILNKTDYIYQKTNSFKYFENQLSVWIKNFKKIYIFQKENEITFIKKHNKKVFDRIKDALNNNIIDWKNCYQNNESKITKIQIISAINLALLEIAKLENLNEKSSSNNSNIKTIMKQTEEVLKKWQEI